MQTLRKLMTLKLKSQTASVRDIALDSDTDSEFEQKRPSRASGKHFHFLAFECHSWEKLQPTSVVFDVFIQ